MLKHVIYNAVLYIINMIVNFKCKETEKIWEGLVSLKYPHDIQQVARKKLHIH